MFKNPSFITVGGRSRYIKYLINPHATPCLWTRHAGTILLNNILRNEVELFAKENNVILNKNDGKKHMLLLKRGSKRQIKNHLELRTRIKERYGDEYSLYIHDDTKLNKTNPFIYYSEFYRADIVIGAFGAGLVNIAFCKPGTVVILIQGSHHKNHKMYMVHAMALGMRYYAYFTETKWRIDVDQVIKVIDLYA